MFLNKKARQADKIIMGDEDKAKGVHLLGDSVINVRVGSKDQLFSAYSYSGDKLNPDFSEYVLDKAKDVPIQQDVTIRIHTPEQIDAAETEQTIKSHYRAEYKEAKRQHKRLAIISAIMTGLGIIALIALILIELFTDNLYITSIVEIAAWVFIWEAVDYFFLQRPVTKGKCLVIQRIYMAKIEICNDSNEGEVSAENAAGESAESEQIL